MRKPMKALATALVVGGCLCALAMPASAACCSAPSTKPTPCCPEPYRPSMCKARQTICGQSFAQPDVTIDCRTNTVNNVYDCNGNLISATLSTDGHFYIVPTNEGNLLIGTGW